MGFEVVEVPDLPPPGQFTHVVKKGKMVFISGQTANPEAEAGNLEPGPQAERVFGYLKSAVEAAGGDMTDIVKINIFLTDLSPYWNGGQNILTSPTRRPPASSSIPWCGAS